ncbi:MAG: uracil-DNA glycosylase family protein [Methylocella sp.]
MADSLIGLLRWYADMGVDIALDAEPHDRLAEAQAIVQRSEAPPSPPSVAQAPRAPSETPTPTPVSRDKAVTTPAPALALEQSARDDAASAQSLEDLREKLLKFEGCGLKATATQLVFGDGDPNAEVMFVGEAPGADEDRQGIPFVGRAGQLLNKMIESIGLERSKVYIANVVPWRPPGNRTPTPLETAMCLPFIRRQIELVGPKIVVCLGAPSAQTLLGSKEGIMRLRGRWFDFVVGDQTIKAIAMLHPAYLLRQPGHKKLAWHDLRLLAKEIARLHAASPRDSA